MFDFSLCAPLVRWVWELRLFTMPDDQSRCDGSVTAINAVVQDMSTGKPTLRCLVRHSNPEPRWQAWVTTRNAHRERIESASPLTPDVSLHRSECPVRANKRLMHRSKRGISIRSPRRHIRRSPTSSRRNLSFTSKSAARIQPARHLSCMLGGGYGGPRGGAVNHRRRPKPCTGAAIRRARKKAATAFHQL
jgi:hypothetical protein